MIIRDIRPEYYRNSCDKVFQILPAVVSETLKILSERSTEIAYAS